LLFLLNQLEKAYRRLVMRHEEREAFASVFHESDKAEDVPKTEQQHF
jgi:hypothetical protein